LARYSTKHFSSAPEPELDPEDEEDCFRFLLFDAFLLEVSSEKNCLTLKNTLLQSLDSRIPSLTGFSFDKHAFTTVKFFEKSTNAVK
jgi:hypothetical protein